MSLSECDRTARFFDSLAHPELFCVKDPDSGEYRCKVCNNFVFAHKMVDEKRVEPRERQLHEIAAVAMKISEGAQRRNEFQAFMVLLGFSINLAAVAVALADVSSSLTFFKYALCFASFVGGTSVIVCCETLEVFLQTTFHQFVRRHTNQWFGSVSAGSRSLFASKISKDVEPAASSEPKRVTFEVGASQQPTTYAAATGASNATASAADERNATIQSALAKSSAPLSMSTAKNGSRSSALQGFQTPHQTPEVLTRKQNGLRSNALQGFQTPHQTPEVLTRKQIHGGTDEVREEIAAFEMREFRPEATEKTTTLDSFVGADTKSAVVVDESQIHEEEISERSESVGSGGTSKSQILDAEKFAFGSTDDISPAELLN